MKQGVDSGTRPELFVVGCTADESHAEHYAEQLLQHVTDPKQGINFFQFLHPGAYPPDASLDAISDVVLRFDLSTVVVVTHSDCGVVDAIQKTVDNPNVLPPYFAGYAREIISLFDKYGVSATDITRLSSNEIARMLTKLIVYRIACSFEKRAHEASLLPADQQTELTTRVTQLSECLISGAMGDGSSDSTEVISLTPARELAQTSPRL